MARPARNDQSPHGLWISWTDGRPSVRMCIWHKGVEYRAQRSIAKHGIDGAIKQCLARLPAGLRKLKRQQYRNTISSEKT